MEKLDLTQWNDWWLPLSFSPLSFYLHLKYMTVPCALENFVFSHPYAMLPLLCLTWPEINSLLCSIPPPNLLILLMYRYFGKRKSLSIICGTLSNLTWALFKSQMISRNLTVRTKPTLDFPHALPLKLLCPLCRESEM